MVLVVDGMGGGVGRSIAEGLKEAGITDVVLVGVNSFATSNMMKSGISAVATGENAVVYNAGRADIIVGPIGIILPNAMLGEISPVIVKAITGSNAKKVLIPIQSECIFLTGIESRNLAQNVSEAVNRCVEYCGRGGADGV